MNENGRDEKISAGRGPAYPYIPLNKAVERAEQLRDANMSRIAASPLSIYKVWGWGGDNGNARQTLAALNHFGLVEYVGRGDDRQVILSDLARRIVLDKVPGSKERASAVREAALTPPIHQKLWEKFGAELPPDVVIETYLMRDARFTEPAAKNLIAEYRATFEFAELQTLADTPDPRSSSVPVEPIIQGSPRTDMFGVPVIAPMMPASSSQTENDIKIMLDGDRLRVNAFVDLRGARRLLKALKANMALLEDEEPDYDNEAAD